MEMIKYLELLIYILFWSQILRFIIIFIMCLKLGRVVKIKELGWAFNALWIAPIVYFMGGLQ